MQGLVGKALGIPLIFIGLATPVLANSNKMQHGLILASDRSPYGRTSSGDSALEGLHDELKKLEKLLDEDATPGGGVPEGQTDVPQVQQIVGPPVALQAGDGFQECEECPKMIVVPTGNFMMGSPESEPKRDEAEGPQRRVTFARPFAMGKFEVTKAEFTAFARETNYNPGNSCRTGEDGKWEERANRSYRNPGFAQGNDHPVVCVNLKDARAFMAWLSRKTGATYRLPSEAELEYATRAGTTTPFWTGAQITPDQANISGKHGKTTPVGSFPANPFGFHDVHGNVGEWVSDCWNNGYHGNPPIDGSPWTSGYCKSLPSRGGSWSNGSWYSRSAARVIASDTRNSGTGFRVVRVLTPRELDR